MMACLPRTTATLIYLDVSAMRRSGTLDLVSGSKAVEDADYRQYVDGTGFDYRRDLRAVAGSFASGEALFLLNGDFNWKRLNAYAVSQGGQCRDGSCRLPATTPGRWISYYRVREKTLALAFSGNELAALNIGPGKAGGLAGETPAAPVWALVPAASLAEANLPAGTRSFTSPLATAERIVFTIQPAASGLEMDLEVTCGSAAGASDLLVKLEGATNMLRKLIERERQQPNPSDLSGLLTSGVFRREDRKVLGAWPLRKEFLEALAGGASP